jgi:mRNA interferase MazF
MKQSEIWFAELSPVRGSEQQGFRPVVIISGNLMNQYLNTVICCPLTTKVKNYKGNVVLKPDKENNLKKASEILTAHIRSISKERLIRRIGAINTNDLNLVKEYLNEMLRY